MVVGIVEVNSSERDVAVKVRAVVDLVSLDELVVSIDCLGVIERRRIAARSKPEAYVVTPDKMTSIRFSRRLRTIHSSMKGVDFLMAFTTLKPFIG